MKIKKSKKAAKTTFDKLSPAKKRVAIAKDVIAQIEAKRYKPKMGTYFTNGAFDKALTKVQDAYNYRPQYEEDVEDIELQTLIRKKLKKCEVCAIGSMFISAVDKANKLTCSETDLDGSAMYEYLNQFFDHEQLLNMEASFEDSQIANGLIVFPNKLGDKKRLLAIMENIVRNKGEFKPEQLSKLYAEEIAADTEPLEDNW